MTYEQFHQLVTGSPHPVILVEGTRDLPASAVADLEQFGRRLATDYPHAVFRTGNAKGADEAFASGIKAVDPKRLQYVLPYAGHRQHAVDALSYQIALTELSCVAEERAAYHTAQSSPEYRTMIDKRAIVPQLRSKARYLLRDTIKVTGATESALLPATVGIFYVHKDNPMKGGTGHTLRVCTIQCVPVAFQDEWMHWPATPPA